MKKILLSIVILVSLLCAVNFAQQQTEATMDPKAAVYYNKAVVALQANEYEQAIASLDSSLIYSQDYRIYYQKGNALLKSGKTQDAKTAFNAAIAKNNNFDRGYYSLANACTILSQYDEAIANYEKVVQISKDEKLKSDSQAAIADSKKYKAVDFYNQGNTALKSEKFAEAVSLYDKSLEITKDSRTYYQKGLALLRLDKTPDAISSFKASIAASDSFDMAYVALAGAYSSMKKYQDAIDNYEKAEQVTKNASLKDNLKEALTKTYLSAGNESMKAKKYDAAIESYKKSLAENETDAAYLSLAKVYIEKKQYSSANEALDKAAQNKKSVSEGAIAYYRGVMALDNKDYKKASEQFKIATTDPAYKKAAAAQIEYISKVSAAKK